MFSVETVPSWPISRTSKEQERLLATADSLSAKKGYSKTDLLPFIPYQRVVPDELHLRIRITNKLLNQVIPRKNITAWAYLCFEAVMINYHNLYQFITSNAGICSVCVRVCVWCSICVCVCLGVCMCAYGDVCDEMNISLCLCKHWALTRWGSTNNLLL